MDKLRKNIVVLLAAAACVAAAFAVSGCTSTTPGPAALGASLPELHYVFIPDPGVSIMGLRGEIVNVLQERINKMGLKDIHLCGGPPPPLGIIIKTYGAKKDEIEEIKKVVEKKGTLCFKIVKLSDDKAKQFGEYTDKEIKEVKDDWKKYEDGLRAWAKNPDKAKKPEEPEFQYHKSAISDPYASKIKHFILRNYEKKPGGKKETTRIDGEYLDSVWQSKDTMGRPALGFKFSKEKRREFGEITEQYKEHYMAVVLDGVVRFAPVIRTRIEGSGIIEGNFSQEEVNRLIVVLKSSALKGKLVLKKEIIPDTEKPDKQP